jgi:hypothetical protein
LIQDLAECCFWLSFFDCNQMKELTTKKLLLGGLVVLFALHPVQVEPVTWVTEHRKS